MDPVVKPVEYVCPLCGQKAVIGRHFCQVPARKRSTLLPLLALGAGFVLVFVLLWPVLHAGAFLVAVAGLGAVLWVQSRGGKK